MSQHGRTGRTSTLRAARWALVAGAVLLGAVLLWSGRVSSAETRAVSVALSRGQAVSLLEMCRSWLHGVATPPPPEVLGRLLEAGRSQGLRHVTLLGRVPVAAGLAVAAAWIEPPAAADVVAPEVHMWPVQGRMRVVARPPPPLGAARAGSDRPPGPFPPGYAVQPPAGPVPAVIIEFEPVYQERLERNARRALTVEAGAAAFLLGGALIGFFWLRRREQRDRSLVEQQHLAHLGEMSAVLAHEIRNPLASLKGHAQLLVEELRAEVPPEPARSRAKAERVVAEAVRIEQLCGGLLEFVRTGAIARAPVDPGQLARAAVAEIGVSIALELADAPARWSLDAGRMQQVLCNLLRNAVEASPEPGTVLLRVRSGRDRLCFEVCDRGPGVPEAAREQIFAPFVTGRTRGTGLGLTVARRIVEAHGGELSVADRVGGGAVFTATIAPGES